MDAVSAIILKFLIIFSKQFLPHSIGNYLNNENTSVSRDQNFCFFMEAFLIFFNFVKTRPTVTMSITFSLLLFRKMKFPIKNLYLTKYEMLQRQRKPMKCLIVNQFVLFVYISMLSITLRHFQHNTGKNEINRDICLKSQLTFICSK